jgi:hypothetical protein
MPVTSFGSSPVAAPRQEAAPAAPAAPTAPTAPSSAVPAGGVGHGETRLMARSTAYTVIPPFIPGTPPPKRETAGAHGAHKGRISIR